MASKQETALIHSLTTVGIRNHWHQDYHFHPLRTDFTGDNGVGKSIVGDLLQLILVVRRDTWRSGTEGMDKDKRRIETMPLDGVEAGYALLNIEVARGRYVAVGVCISSRSNVPVKALIVHRGAELTVGTALLSFDRPLTKADFLNEGEIMDLDAIKRRLFRDKDLHLHEFSKGDRIKEYHKVLFNNKVLPVDLSREGNLEMFANVVQSFSRAKSLEINKSGSLKNFIFPAQGDVVKIFEEKKGQLAKYIQQYHALERERKGIQMKQEQLTNLRDVERKKLDARFAFLQTQATHSWQQMRRHEGEVARCEREIERIVQSLVELESSIGQLLEEKRTLEQRRRTNDNDQVTLKGLILSEKELGIAHGQLNEASSKKDALEKQIIEGNKSIENWSEELETLEKDQPEFAQQSVHFGEQKNQAWKMLEDLKPILAAVGLFGGVDALEELIGNQARKEEEVVLLKALRGIPHYETFERSEFARIGVDAHTLVDERLQALGREIGQLEGLLSLYDQENTDSLFQWAVNRGQTLTLGQETVLMQFKNVSVKQVTAEDGAQYTLNPQGLLDGIEETPTGVWVKLGNLQQFIGYQDQRLFALAETLTEVIEKGKEETLGALSKLKAEKSETDALRQELLHLGFQEKHWRVYQDRGEVESYRHVAGLPSAAQWETWRSLLPELANYDAHVERYETTSKRYEHYHGLKARAEVQLGTVRQNIRQETKNQAERSEEIESHLRTSKNAQIEIVRIEADIIRHKSQLSFKLDAAISKEELQTRLQAENADIRSTMASNEERLNQIRDNQLRLAGEQGTLKGELPGHQRQLETWKAYFDKHLVEFQDFSDQALEPEKTTGRLTQEDVNAKESTARRWEVDYKAGYDQVVSQYEEARMAPRVLHDRYSFRALEEVLLGTKIKHLDNVDAELSGMNEELRQIAEGHWTVVIDVFKEVEKKFDTCRRTVTQLNHFFQETRISKNYVIDLVFKPSDGLKIEWISKMRQVAQDRKLANTLFAENVSDSPEEILERLAAQFSNSKQYSIRQLLDEKQYFDLRLDLKGADTQQQFSGSHGQSYMAISLLCIGRLSIVERESEKTTRPGIRFLIVEELANLDENNFSAFPKLALEYGYQMITMTPKPFGGYTAEGAFVHMLSPGKDGSLVNIRPYSAFIKDGIRGELSKYFKIGNDGLESA